MGYTPAQVRTAYGISSLIASGTTGAGETVAIVDAFGSPTMAGDLALFSSQFGLPAANLTIAYPSGKPKRTDGGWALETSLDVEWVHAIAPGAKILLCVAKSASTADLMAAVDYASANAQIVSNSWGGNEFSGETSYDSHFNKPGVTFTVSSGDNGAGAEWPAVSPYVIAVGGTTLNLDSSGNRLSETGWSGSGGGASAYITKPAYQSSVTGIVGNMRGTPDISFVADPSTGVAVYDSTQYNGKSGWYRIGGTSVGAPCVAALIALLNQGHASYNSLDLLTKLYSTYALGSAYPSDFYDITQGYNGKYNALAGYDMVTGIGSPGQNFISYFTAK